MSEYDDVPVRRLAEARDGTFMRFVGRVVAAEGELLTAPLTGRRCVAFDAAVFQFAVRLELVPLDYREYEPQLMTRTLRAMPFILEDATGRALVDPRGAFVRLTLDHKQGGPGVRIETLTRRGRIVSATHATEREQGIRRGRPRDR